MSTKTDKVAMIGTLRARDGKAEEMEAVLARLVDAAEGEPGTEMYAYFRGPDDTFHFFALMTDQDAMQSHGQTEAVKAVMADFMPLMDGPPQMGPARPIAANGLDL